MGLHALDREGRLLWRQALSAGGELSAPLLRRPLRAGLVGATAAPTSPTRGAGSCYQFFAPGHGVTAEPISDGQQVYVLSNGGHFYALGLNKL